MVRRPRMRVIGAILALAGAAGAAGCDRVLGFDLPVAADAVAVDAADALDAAPPVAGTPFGTPVVLAGIQTAGEEDDPSLTADLRELYFLSAGDLWRSTRESDLASWSQPVAVDELNTAAVELRPSVSADGLTLYFTRDNGGQRDVFVSERADRMLPWGAGQLVAGDVNDPVTNEIGGGPSADRLTLYFESYVGPLGLHDLYIATRPGITDPFVRAPFTELNLPDSNEGAVWANADGTNLVFESDRGGTMAIWEAVRVGSTWAPVAHPELDSSLVDGTPWLSPDGRTIVFSSNRVNGSNDDLFMATR